MGYDDSSDDTGYDDGSGIASADMADGGDDGYSGATLDGSEQDAGTDGSSADAASLPGILIRYKPVCSNCGWQGGVGFESDAVAEGNNHVDDHPKCAGKIEIRKVSWYDGSPVE